jgi:hypothetical protein
MRQFLAGERREPRNLKECRAIGGEPEREIRLLTMLRVQRLMSA